MDNFRSFSDLFPIWFLIVPTPEDEEEAKKKITRQYAKWRTRNPYSSCAVTFNTSKDGIITDGRGLTYRVKYERLPNEKVSNSLNRRKMDKSNIKIRN